MIFCQTFANLDKFMAEVLFYILLCSANTAEAAEGTKIWGRGIYNVLGIPPALVGIGLKNPGVGAMRAPPPFRRPCTVYNKASLMLERGNLYFQRICNFGLFTESYQKLLFVQTLCMKNLYFMQSMFLLKSLLYSYFYSQHFFR